MSSELCAYRPWLLSELDEENASTGVEGESIAPRPFSLLEQFLEVLPKHTNKQKVSQLLMLLGSEPLLKALGQPLVQWTHGPRQTRTAVWASSSLLGFRGPTWKPGRTLELPDVSCVHTLQVGGGCCLLATR